MLRGTVCSRGMLGFSLKQPFNIPYIHPGGLVLLFGPERTSGGIHLVV